MAAEKPHIDSYLFELQFDKFCEFIEKKSPHAPPDPFASHPYIHKQEGYKYEVHATARARLGFEKWKKSEIGSGKIIRAAIEAVETPDNNLVQWRERARTNSFLLETRDNVGRRQNLERCLFGLYRESREAESFSELVDIFGKRYALIAYFFFLKDASRYAPIAPSYFDTAFQHLGVKFKTSHSCSWDNYSHYLALLGELKALLEENLEGEVTLLDAHTFAWMLGSQMAWEGSLADYTQYDHLPATERDALVKARLYQGKFREKQLAYWNMCAVTGCTEWDLLRASHIKPWSESSPQERLCLYNGLLLSPHLDACFDRGFVSFDDTGRILISSQLGEEDRKALGLHGQLRLCESKIDPRHAKYLAYHRKRVYRDG